MVFTGLIGMLVAPGRLHPVLQIAAAVLYRRGRGRVRRDQHVVRPRYRRHDAAHPQAADSRRPAAPESALGFGLVLATGSVLIMFLATNVFAASALALSILFYVFIYTIWLKRRTPQNIVIGGAAGAFPPVIGWAAVTGSVGLVPILLFAIVFFWTPPHFWSLALWANEDYRRAGIPMLPVTAGARETRRQIVIYTLLLVSISLAPWLVGFSGPFYATVATLFGHRLSRSRLASVPGSAGCDGAEPYLRCAREEGVQIFDHLSVPAVRRLGPRPDGRLTQLDPDAERDRRRRGRNLAMLVVLLALAALFFAITLVKLTRI